MTTVSSVHFRQAVRKSRKRILAVFRPSQRVIAMSCIPNNWMEGSKRRLASAPSVSSKRQKTSFDDMDSEHRDLVAWLLRTMREQNRDRVCAPTNDDESDSELVVEACAMLNATPFASMLATIPISEPSSEVPIVTRAYEEQYMHGVLHKNDKLCVMGNECECMLLDPKNKFVCVQFEIPYTSGTAMNNLCIFCLRKITQLLYYETVERGLPIKQVIQRHGNICGQEREYHPSAMLVGHGGGPVNCLPLPIVAHQRNKLRVETVGGVPFVRQRGMYMEDF
jgi:hypothetical protein